jgi:hypothetical protein
MPKRIQISRQRPWKKPTNKGVARPSRWGNPYPVATHGREQALALFEAYVAAMDPQAREALLAPLLGKDLACWCALDQPCHADVWLRWANP